MRHALLPAVVLLSLIPAVSAAQAPQNVSADDLVKLSAAGLNDDILIALIESDRAVFRLGADDILSLRDRGLSQRVILAMLQTARRPVATAAVAPAAGVAPPLDSVQPVVAYASPQDVAGAPPGGTPPPVVVNVTQHVDQQVESPDDRSYPYPYSYPYFPAVVTYPVAVPVHSTLRRTELRHQPVFWGFGGQRRPDTWKPPVRVNRR